jgi:hypothetical protein
MGLLMRSPSNIPPILEAPREQTREARRLEEASGSPSGVYMGKYGSVMAL